MSRTHLESCFKNTYGDYGTDDQYDFFNEDGKFTTAFRARLEKYKSEKYEHLTKNLRHLIADNASVYTGSAGIALLHYIYALNDEPNFEKWLRKVAGYIDLSNIHSKKPSFFCGDGGPLALAIIVAYILRPNPPENLWSYQESLEKLIELSKCCSKSETPEEILYGCSGYLFACMFVNKSLGKEKVPHEVFKKVIVRILQSGKTFAKSTNTNSSLLWQWHDKMYLGAAHGVAGILDILLRLKEHVPYNELNTSIRPAIDWLIAQQYREGNLPSSLKKNHSEDRLVQWCHGAPGLIPLCLRAYKTYEDRKYLKAALKASEVVWQRGLLKKGYSLCHGVSGNAFSFLAIYNATGDKEQLYRACCFADWLMAEMPYTELSPPDRPASLFEGLAGRLYFVEELLNPGKMDDSLNIFL